MSAVKSIQANLSELLHRSTPYQDGSSLVPKLNYNEIENRLKSKELGEQRAKDGLPKKDSSVTDEVEWKILNTYQELIDKTSSDVNESLAAYNQRIISLDLTGMIDNIRDAARASISEFHASVSSGLSELKISKEDVIEKNNDYLMFKEENYLRRSASYPTEVGKFARALLILFIFFIETSGNAVFLSKGNEGGIIGAYSEAILISFLNLGTAFLIGLYVSRHMFNHRMLPKALSYLAVCVGVILAAFFNLAVAHYRELSGIGLFGEAGTQAIQRMMDHPFSLSDFQGWMLFLVGWFFWIVSLIDSHTLDDNFPGYGKLHRSLKLARKNYTVTKTDIIDELSDYRSVAEDEIKNVRKQLSDLLGQISSIVSLRKALLNDYGIFAEQSDRLFNQSLETYRNSNILNREEAPLCFKNNLSLSIPRYEGDIVAVNLDKISAQVNEGKKDLDIILDKFYEEFKSAVDSFQILDILEKNNQVKEEFV